MFEFSNRVFVEAERFPDMLAVGEIDAYFELPRPRVEVQLARSIAIALPTEHFETLLTKHALDLRFQALKGTLLI